MADPDPDGSYVTQLIVLLILILINAFFAMAEMAVVSVNKNNVRASAEDGKRSAKLLLKLMSKPNKFLSTIQVWITLAGFLQSALAATAVSDDFGAWIDKTFGISAGSTIAVVIRTIVLSFFNLVLGELAPKRIAMQYADRIAPGVAGVIWFVSKIAAPFVWLLSVTVAGVVRLFGIKGDNIEERYSEEEIKSHLEVGIETGLIDETGKEMITSVFEFDDKLAYEIMTPRTDVYMINIDSKLEDYVDDLLKSRFSRVPYYGKDSDDIIGVLYMKDFIIQAKKVGFNRVGIKKLLQKPFFVPETKNINELFLEMQEDKKHMAFLIDEYGGVSGIVTIEDIVEEIMGAIDDEYDDYEPKIAQISELVYELDGNFYLDDLNDELGLSLESDDYETIGGLLMDEIGEIPDDKEGDGQIVEIDGITFRIKNWKDRRIDSIVIELPEPDPADEDGESDEDDD
jgi:putative hemolysin